MSICDLVHLQIVVYKLDSILETVPECGITTSVNVFVLVKE